MNPGELVASLSARERMDMQMMGLSPLNENDVRKYRSGNGISAQEKIERAQTLFAGANNLGGGKEKEINAFDMVGQSYNKSELETPNRERNESDYRKLLNQDMKEYDVPASKTFNSDDLLSLKRKPMNESVLSQDNNEEMKLEGFNKAKKYLNAFIINLQSPSSKTRLQLFNELKACLQSELKYKNNPSAANAYKAGEKKAEDAMLKNLMG